MGQPLDCSASRKFLEEFCMADVRRGLIIVNTGPGKGKTTAAMGTALRAVGNGMRVLMLQFLKGSWHYGELDAVKAFGDNFIMKQMGRGFVKVGGAETDPEDVRLVEEAWAEAEKEILSGQWDLVVLDEINYAITYKMLDPAKVVATLKKKPEMVHVILTGTECAPRYHRDRRHRDRDERSEARLHQGHRGAARHRVLAESSENHSPRRHGGHGVLVFRFFRVWTHIGCFEGAHLLVRRHDYLFLSSRTDFSR